MTGEAAIETVRFSLETLRHPAEILVDCWGVPHVRAADRLDLFLAQGFNAARDRLWQLDLWRKRGLGLLAADFGPGYLAQDRAARLFLYRGDMAAEWAAYGVPDMEAVVTAFVAGINAFIDQTESRPELLPPEFGVLGTRPARWAAEDVVRIRSHALVSNALSEAARAQVLVRADLATDLVRRSIDPPHRIERPDGFDAAAVPARALDVLQLATAPVTFTPERLAARLDEAWRWSRVSELGEIYAAPAEDGSNNWAVAGSRTATGRPILASDPHRTYALPSLRYVVHLTAPGLDVIGAGEPAVPGISFGHNGHAAFSLTIFPTDQEDLYVYETEPGPPPRYRYGGGSEAIRSVRERIPVAGAPDQEVELLFTRHGPVIFADPAQGRAVALRTVWSEPGSAAYLASLGAMLARSPAEYRQALRHWGAPAANHVYADRDGHVGWFVAGKAPRRPNWDGLLPVPGDGRYEWDGFHDPADLPASLDPERGWVASANEMNLPADYPAEDRKLGFEFFEPARADRIAEVLGADTAHSLDAAMRLQTDDLSGPARRLLRLVPPEGGPAAALLAGWDGSLHETSAAAALFEVWWTRHLKPALLARAAPDRHVRRLLAPGDHETLLGALERPGQTPWLATEAERDALLSATLAEAHAACAALLGPDPAGWAWGRLHHGYFEHPLEATGLAPDELGSVGPLPKGGSGSTVMNTRYRPADFRAVSGASFRMVVDVGSWDESRFINAPGQSGDPRSPHYGDLAEIWAARRYLPLLYGREAVEAATATRIALVPARPTRDTAAEQAAAAASPAGARSQ
ncbi:penicillin acylase family protein [Enterovirga sp.]|uniref:penicillin acylase family protein n=1 Tax=Enterovirga sp. TaxID=2026350 RepID=UPI00261FE688|nr:penicillin acylase family protein [Enterovirga sp.]MDB5589944.1 peptidase penicillin amidase [Enterovirga sp.]